MRRREMLVALGGSAAAYAYAPDEGNYLLVSQAEIDAAKDKARRQLWARAGLAKLTSDAEAALARPMDIPERGGQWGHWYVCKKDGVTLTADSPTRHRCPKCGDVYSGYPYDDVYLTRIHVGNALAMRDMGLAFRFTARAEFAAKARDLLLAYAKRYQSYPRRDNLGKDSVNAARVLSQTLDESTWLIPVTWGYSLVRGTLSASDRETIERDLLIAAVDVIVGRSYARLPNIQCWKNSAIGCVGFALHNDDLIAEALDHPVRGFRALMARYVLPGGLWYEGSLGYHQYTMAALWALTEAARHNGVDLYAHERYRSMFRAPLALALPNGDAPGYNDNPGANVSTMANLYDIAFARWQDPLIGRVARLGSRESVTSLLYGAESLPDGPVIPSESVVLREAGYAVLRSADVAVAVRFGLHGGGHGHPDKLNVVTAMGATTFGLDPGSIGYGAPLHGEWYRSTIAHNTVCVDEGIQGNADGSLLEWSHDAAATILKACANEVYKGVAMTRTLSLSGQDVDDEFECSSDLEHTYDWAFHAPGRLVLSFNAAPKTSPIGTKNGYQHIEDVKEGRVDGDWWARWESGQSSLTLHVKGSAGTVVFTGNGPGRNAADRVPAVIIRRRAKATSFETRHTYRKT